MASGKMRADCSQTRIEVIGIRAIIRPRLSASTLPRPMTTTSPAGLRHCVLPLSVGLPPAAAVFAAGAHSSSLSLPSILVSSIATTHSRAASSCSATLVTSDGISCAGWLSGSETELETSLETLSVEMVPESWRDRECYVLCTSVLLIIRILRCDTCLSGARNGNPQHPWSFRDPKLHG